MAEQIGQTQSQPGQSQNQPGMNNNGGNQPGTNTYQPKQVGSGFTNLNQFLQANQGNQVGNTIGNDIGQQANQAQTQGSQALSAFNQQLQGQQQNLQNEQQNEQQTLANYGYTPPGQSGGSQPGQSSSGTANTGLLNQPLGSTTNTDYQAATNQQVQDFGNYRSGNYSGPTGLSNAQQLQQTAQNVGNYSTLAGNAGGQQALLQNFLGQNGNYNSGEQNLDQLLVGQGGGLQQGAAQAQNAQNSINQSINQATLGGQQMAQNYAQFGTQTNQDLANANTQFTNNLNAQAAADQAFVNNSAQQIQSQLAAGGNVNLTAQEAAAFGFQPGQTNFTNGAQQFFNPLTDVNGANPTNAATAQNDYTAQQAAQMYALSQLAGTSAGSQYAPGTNGQFNQGTYTTLNNPAWTGAGAQTAPVTTTNANGSTTAPANAAWNASGANQAYQNQLQTTASDPQLQALLQWYGSAENNVALNPNDQAQQGQITNDANQIQSVLANQGFNVNLGALPSIGSGGVLGGQAGTLPTNTINESGYAGLENYVNTPSDVQNLLSSMNTINVPNTVVPAAINT